MVPPVLTRSDMIAMLPSRIMPEVDGLVSLLLRRPGELPVTGFPLHLAWHRRRSRMRSSSTSPRYLRDYCDKDPAVAAQTSYSAATAACAGLRNAAGSCVSFSIANRMLRSLTCHRRGSARGSREDAGRRRSQPYFTVMGRFHRFESFGAPRDRTPVSALGRAKQWIRLHPPPFADVQ